MSAGHHAPTVTSLAASPNPIASGASTPLTLTANGVADAENDLASVSFWRESNGQAGLQTGAGGDALLATDTSGDDNWTTGVSVQTLPAGTYTYHARATDNAGAVSNVVSTSHTISPPPNTAPVIASLSDSPEPATAGSNVALVANGVSDAEANVSAVRFYRESNGQAGLQTGAGGDALLGSDASADLGWTIAAPTTGLAPGTYTYYAQVVDAGGLLSNVVSTTNTVPPTTPPGGGAEVIVDNAAATFAGDWGTSTAVAGYYGNNFRHDLNTGKGNKSATFTPTLASAGTYRVYARWTANPNRATNTPIDIAHTAGVSTVTVHQQLDGGAWVLRANTPSPPAARARSPSEPPEQTATWSPTR
ncbi:MAG: hypothetical protein ACREIT_03290 [Tepidisphaeraceae bacterium]